MVCLMCGAHSVEVGLLQHGWHVEWVCGGVFGVGGEYTAAWCCVGRDDLPRRAGLPQCGSALDVRNGSAVVRSVWGVGLLWCGSALRMECRPAAMR